MFIFFLIAEISAHISIILDLEGGVGLLSGLFGGGVSFLMMPLLIFGVPPAVVVDTKANRIAVCL